MNRLTKCMSGMVFSFLCLWTTSGFADDYFATCVQGYKCTLRYEDGVCREWSRYEVCGRYCANGVICGSEYKDGHCRDWETTAQCGNNSCKSEHVCGSRYDDGACRYWEIEATCN